MFNVFKKARKWDEYEAKAKEAKLEALAKEDVFKCEVQVELSNGSTIDCLVQTEGETRWSYLKREKTVCSAAGVFLDKFYQQERDRVLLLNGTKYPFEGIISYKWIPFND